MDIQTQIHNLIPTANSKLTVVDSCNEFIQLFCPCYDQISMREDIDRKKSIFANRTIYKESLIVQVPYAQFINAQMGQLRSNLLHYIYKIKECLQKDDQEQYMRKQIQYLFRQNQHQSTIPIQVLVYLIQKGCMRRSLHSSWEIDKIHSKFIELLPKDYQSHPVNYINLIEFRHQPIQMRLVHMKTEIARFYEAFQNILGSSSYLQIFLEYFNESHLFQQYKQAFSYENIQWAIMVHQTRSFNRQGLVPMLDLFNYSTQPNAQYFFDNALKKAVLIATKDIGPNEQIVINYGPDRSIQELFSVYGLVCVDQICQTDLAFVKGQEIFYRRIAYSFSKYEQKSFFNYICYNIYEIAKFFDDQLLTYCKIFFTQCLWKKEFFSEIKIEYQNLLKAKQTTKNEASIINSVMKIIGVEENFIQCIMEREERVVKMLKKLKRLQRQLQ